MDKINPTTPDLTQENIEKIAALFPDVVTEATDADGNVVRAIDFDALKDDLSSAVVDGPRERYQFTWPGKREAKLEARRPTKKVMRPNKGKSKDWDTTQNLYIEGDNLEALKIMRETYAGKVKLIYIDPPYNTGKDRIYRDDFSQDRERYEAESGDYDEQGDRLTVNPETNGRFHSDWCSMIYPRLLLARDLLSNDGTIFINIDDSEVANLRRICDEVFGGSNFEGHIHWRRRHNQPNDKTKMLGLVAEHIIVYAKDSQQLKKSGVGKLDSTAEFRNPDNDPKGPWASKPWKVGSDQSGSRYEIAAPGGEIFDEEWMGERTTFERFLAEGRMYFTKDGHGLPRKKYYKSEREEEGQCATNWWSHELFGHNQAGNDRVKNLFDGVKNIFSNPKPIELMQGILKVGNVKDGDVVLDFFSGSGSMADAVMQLNCDDSAKRRFVMIQVPEKIKEGEPASCLGYETLTEVGEERIRRAGTKVVEEVNAANVQLELGAEPRPVPDVGFRVLEVAEPAVRDEYAEPAQYEQSQLGLFADNAVEGASDLDVLFQALPAFRIPYSATITERELGGKRVYDVNEGQLIACFDEGVDAKAIEAIAKERPLYALFRDACFAGDADVSNLEELFKTFSPDTIRKVI
ncbi:site-specific DNA-methyltransferase [Paratractidigestivibacter sp.]|uniref:site-specific DNA-methyltransferase n=1 Tax=Paratractidigestivibacter sp. TaxID=2847316 RepID=UPI002ACB0635|nr:site-specific DNA-methyltransferase [Paratractidigestivibacter sp.]